MKCYNCGAELPDGAKCCLCCGRKVGAGNPTSSTQAEGEPEHLDPNRQQIKTKGKRVVFPPLLRCMFTVVLLLLAVLVFLHAK